MIDYFALALGHGLLVLTFIRLFMRESLDVDPAIEELKGKAEGSRPNLRYKRRAAKSHDGNTAPPHDHAQDQTALREHETPVSPVPSSISAKKAARRLHQGCSKAEGPRAQ